ncbi:phytanoyl-CoA dioxygenase family protein [Pendulispora brunnea]|uniref:Phytanoyl-CoA dioxygenase family protein n=1 Tax=Pendulispora brunnea TaxID=2905690 RepID=A0ABZ2KQL6_9BACT
MVSFGDLTSKGYVLLRSFLTQEELQALRSDFESLRRTSRGASEVQMVALDTQRQFEDKLAAIATAVHADTGIRADARAEAGYFATSTGLAFPWHQDYGSYFIFQQHTDYLNFYIPIVKPDLETSNLSIVPFDALTKSAPDEGAKLVGGGACRFLPMAEDGTTRVVDDEVGQSFTLPVHLDALAVTPRLVAGDLLLLRGDMIHKTQDGATDRVAVSFRRVGTHRILKRSRLLQGGPTKQAILAASRALYGPIQHFFARTRKDEASTGEYLAFAERLMSTSFAEPHYVQSRSVHHIANERIVG